jgi:hypothetical protein
MLALRSPEYYRRRADELRQAAAGPCSTDNRETLLCFAADLDMLAREAEGDKPTRIAKRPPG